jgi:hypothetical protein
MSDADVAIFFGGYLQAGASSSVSSSTLPLIPTIDLPLRKSIEPSGLSSALIPHFTQ